MSVMVLPLFFVLGMWLPVSFVAARLVSCSKCWCYCSIVIPNCRFGVGVGVVHVWNQPLGAAICDVVVFYDVFGLVVVVGGGGVLTAECVCS